MYPEEKLAAKLHRRHNLILPVDIKSLLSRYARVIEVALPWDMDGLCIDLKTERVRVLYDPSKYRTRVRFTLAHELGHVLIPWHIGNVSDKIDDSSPGEDSSIEDEANRFASELLIPRAYIERLLNEAGTLSEILRSVQRETDTSKIATFIKVSRCIPIDRFLARVGDKGEILSFWGGHPFRSKHKIYGLSISKFADASLVQTFQFEGKKYVYGSRGQILATEPPLPAVKWPASDADDRTWRAILSKILDDVATDPARRQNLLLSVNATINSRFNRHAKKASLLLYEDCLVTIFDNDRCQSVALHPLFSLYVVKRIDDLSDPKRSKKR